jgi:membrane-bound metal-dependent hydrolase YbcI (DUF457 family)
MPNAQVHMLGGFVAGMFAHAAHEDAEGESTAKPLIGGVFGAFSARLPDVLEPATSPNHRQTFHSLLCAGLVGYGLYKVAKWKPETKGDELLRLLLLIGGAAYLSHLVLDGLTPQSLPLA